MSSNKNSGYARVRRLTQKDQQQNCSVHSRASSSLKNPQCSAVGEAEVSSDLQSSFHSPIEWACDRVTDSHPPTNEPCRQTLRGRPRLSYREHHWIAPMRLTAAQPGPWLRPATLLPLSEQQQKRPVRATDKPPNLNKKPPKQNEQQITVMTPPPAREKEVTGEGTRNLRGTDSSGRSNPSQLRCFPWLVFQPQPPP